MYVNKTIQYFVYLPTSLIFFFIFFKLFYHLSWSNEYNANYYSISLKKKKRFK